MENNKHRIIIDLDEYNELMASQKELKELTDGKKGVCALRNIRYGMGWTYLEVHMVSESDAIKLMTEEIEHLNNRLDIMFNEKSALENQLRKLANTPKKWWQIF